MSTMIPTERRTWLPLAAGMSLLLAGIWGMLVLPRRDIPSSRRPTDAISITDPSIPQARWEARVFPAGVLGDVSKSEKALVKRARPKVVTTVREIYDALLLAPGRLNDLRGNALTPEAAAALARSGLAVPKGMNDIRTTKRVANIGIEVETARRAAARVSVSYRGMLNDKPVKIAQRATLWLEDDGKHWLVIAFNGEQGRVR
ncbi:MAG: hypothetical protein ACRDLB_08410 [Actinomycetota bacterium]